MSAFNLAAKGTRVVIFMGGLIALLEGMRFVLSHPALRTALGISLLLSGVLAVLAAWAWTLHKLWILSGIAAAVLFHSQENKIEVRA